MVDPNTNLIYVGSGDGNTSNTYDALTVINGSNNSVVQTVTGLNDPIYLALDPLTNRLYVSTQLDKAVYVYQTATSAFREIDTLTGGNGPDTFVLGDKDNVYYAANDDNDYALITDFSQGDVVRLKGKPSEYILDPNFTLGGISGTGIFLKEMSGSTRTIDLIGLLQDASVFDLNSKAFSFV